MPAKQRIRQLECMGLVVDVLIGQDYNTLITKPNEKIKLFINHGIHLDRHAGNAFVSRESHLVKFGVKKDTECANLRQWSAVSEEEIVQIAKNLGIERIHHGLLGENLIISGISNFSNLPIGTQFMFKSPSGELRNTILFATGQNDPCISAGEAIQQRNIDQKGLASKFVKVAYSRRGLMGLVYVSGVVKKGDKVFVFAPVQ